MSFFLQEKHVTNSQYSEQAIKGEDGQKFRVPSLGTRDRKTSSLARFRTTISAVVNAEDINTRRHGTSQPGSTYGEHFQIFQVSLTWTNSTFLLQSIFYRKLPISRAPIFRSLDLQQPTISNTFDPVSINVPLKFKTNFGEGNSSTSLCCLIQW